MKRSAALLLALTLALPALASRRRAVSPAPRLQTSAYLEAARETANWLQSVERRSPSGIGWPWSDKNSWASPGLGSGAAGIALFHLRLYQVTRDERYLGTARGAADFVAFEYSRGGEGGFDWQSGAVGGGELFVLMYRETGEARYLDRARSVASYLLAQAKRDANGVHWEFPGVANVFTGISHGAAGAGVFFLHLHELTKETQYLDVARDAYRWMRQHHLPIGNDGIGWKRLTKDATAYHGFCGGASGIIYFIDELHRATEDESYQRDLVATANGLLHSADKLEGDRAGWRYTTASQGNRPVVYCHGTSCAATAMVHAWELTGDPRYRDLARAAARQLDAIATTVDGDGPVWRHIENAQMIETGFQTGAASVGYAYLRLHASLGDRAYLDQAIAAGDLLLRVADRPAPGQMRWINYKLAPPSGEYTVAYETGWYAGAAGIGLFLLDLHDRVTGRPPLDRFSPLHP